MRTRSYPFLQGNYRKAAVAFYCFSHYFSTYFRGITNNNLPSNKFIILGMQRTGSSLLGEIAASNPDVYWDREKFNPRYAAPLTFLQGISSESSKSCYGVKVFSDLFFSHDSCISLEKFLEKIHKNNWKIIAIFRKNSLRQAVSLLKANYKLTNFYQLNNHKSQEKQAKNKQKLTIQPQMLIDYIKKIEEYKQIQLKATAKVNCLNIVYENDLETEQKIKTTSEKVFEYLGLTQPSKLNIFLSKQSNPDLFGQFANKEELITRVTNSEYSRYLN